MFERRLGLHFDFHAHPYEGMPSIGETLKEEDIREICRLLQPDYLQIDCKGHPGWASYPTKCGNAMPSFTCDPLRLWRRVTREEGIKLFLHYSGVIDAKFCQEHPELAVMRPDGSRSGDVTRTYGLEYANRLLIPQLKELAGEYGADGVWIDGDCWGTDADYDPETLAAFEAASGIQLCGGFPPDAASEEAVAFKEYCRELFRKFVRHYTDELHKAYPSFMITSNWMYSDHMPEPVSADLDYLSGDFNPWNSVSSARLAGRALARQGKHWDLMSWNFRSDRDGCSVGRYIKHPVQILQEAATVLSLGGGYQNYIPQNRDGSPRMEQIRSMRRVFDWARERLPWCYGGSILPQAAVFLSGHDRMLASKKLFTRDGLEGTSGLTDLLCDLGHGVSVASEFDHARGFALIAVPETVCSLGDAPKQLLNYAAEGGSLLICGIRSIEAFIEAGLPVSIGGRTEEVRFCFPDEETCLSLYGSCTLSAPGAETVFRSCADAREASQPVACLLSFGKGKIALVGSDIGLAYCTAKQAGHRKLLKALLSRLYDPIVRLEGAEGTVEVTPLYKDGRLLVQLVNMNGPHSDRRVPSFDFISPCLNVRLSAALSEKPQRIVQRPCGKSLPFDWDGRRATFTVYRVDIHEIIELPASGLPFDMNGFHPAAPEETVVNNGRFKEEHPCLTGAKG